MIGLPRLSDRSPAACASIVRPLPQQPGIPGERRANEMVFLYLIYKMYQSESLPNSNGLYFLALWLGLAREAPFGGAAMAFGFSGG